jgi:hypothetical protein
LRLPLDSGVVGWLGDDGDTAVLLITVEVPGSGVVANRDRLCGPTSNAGLTCRLT